MATRSKRTRGAAFTVGDASDHGDFPLHTDPSLMTERQQLAFLLRKTAQENGHDSASSRESSSASESSDDEALRRAPKKPRRALATTTKASPKSPPPASREDLIAAALKNPAGLVLYCGRGRPPKNAIKLAPGEEMPPDLKKLVEAAASHLRRNAAVVNDAVKTLRVQTDDPDEKKLTKGTANKSHDKTSPSGPSELSQHLYDDHEFGVAPCALCCGVNSPFDAPLEALFLCPTCDRKYPTQRALGLV